MAHVWKHAILEFYYNEFSTYNKKFETLNEPKKKNH
jgi:hypothetical protein